MTRPATPDEIADHDRDLRKHEAPQQSLEQLIADIPRRAAVSRIVGYCEGIIRSGILGDEMNRRLHHQVDEVCIAFGMPVKPAERTDA